MISGYIDIPHEALASYANAVKNTGRREVCKIIPRGRFNLCADGTIEFSTLVCSSIDMNGEATGIGADYCYSCPKKESKLAQENTEK